MEKIKLFEQKKDCCSCSACYNICPKKAISMKTDDFGFIYPNIDYEKCISCGLCKIVCSYQNKSEVNEVNDTYVAASIDDKILMNSASGGVFAVFANYILSLGGVVFGCSMEYEEGLLTPKHIRIESKQELHKLQGSKYVQSEIGDTYTQAKNELLKGKQVLFAGTPCQIAGLYGFLQKDYENLLTIDLICHGVPSVSFFQGYINQLEKKNKASIVNIKFRDKSDGWGLNGKLFYKSSSNIIRTKKISVNLSSYYRMFLNSDIYRENCHSCKYANNKRPGDLTVGDYWGIEREHPEYLTINGGVLDEKKGISCILVNTSKGKEYVLKNEKRLLLLKSEFEKVANQNKQLKRPSEVTTQREIILNIFKEQGYKGVDKYFYKKLGIKRYIYMVWDNTPKCFKAKIKILLKR